MYDTRYDELGQVIFVEVNQGLLGRLPRFSLTTRSFIPSFIHQPLSAGNGVCQLLVEYIRLLLLFRGSLLIDGSVIQNLSFNSWRSKRSPRQLVLLPY